MKRKYCILLAVFLLLMTSILTSCSVEESYIDNNKVPQEQVLPATETATVHFIDVGQADCSFIQLPDGRTVLIDGGNRADADTIISYLKGLKVDKIDYLIATHPHEDHIGSLPNIIRSFEIGSIYMPKVTANTKIFEELLLSIKEKGLKINTAAAGVEIINTKDTKLTLVAPNSAEYDELNNYSAVAKLTYKDTSYLFTGDAEDISEKEILKNKWDVKADVLKVGHHGGSTSTTEEFLAKVSPEYAIISVGRDNDYGHPHKETLERLNVKNLKIYRTDIQGTIVATSDGKTIIMNKAPVVLEEKKSLSPDFYIGNKNSKIFHLPSCSSLPKPENQIRLNSKQEAQAGGYKPCNICKP